MRSFLGLRLADAGIGHWVTPEPVHPPDQGIAADAAGPLVADVQAMLRSYGYDIEPTGVFGFQDRVRGARLPAALPA